MHGRVLFGESADPEREILFAGRDRGDETVLHIRTARDAQFRYLRNAYPDRPFLELNRYKESSYPIIGLMRDLHAKGELSGPPAALMADRRPAEELYDLKADPYEVHNLADEPAYLETKKRLAAALTDWQDAIGDRGRQPEPPAVVAKWEAAMKRAYDEKNASRDVDWFRRHPALGAYPPALVE